MPELGTFYDETEKICLVTAHAQSLEDGLKREYKELFGFDLPRSIIDQLVGMRRRDAGFDMYSAAERGLTEALRAWADMGTDLDQPNPCVWPPEREGTPLFIACTHGHSDCVRLLIDYGCNVDATRPMGYRCSRPTESALMRACFGGHLDCVRHLVEGGAQLNHKGWSDYSDYSEDTALMNAVRSSSEARLDCARVLVEAGCDIHLRNSNKEGALMLAVRLHRTEIVKLLVEHKCYLHKSDWHGHDVVYKAISVNNKEALKLFYEKGRKAERSHLEQAASVDSSDLVELILANGEFDLNQKVTAFSQGARYDEFQKSVKILQDAGFEVDANNGEFVVNAARKGDSELLRELIDSKADVNFVSQNPEHPRLTPLIWASRSDRWNCVKMLIEAGCDLNRADQSGRTALTWCAIRGNQSCMGLLISAGCDLNHADCRGRTPLIWAARNNFVQCLWLLLKEDGCEREVKGDGGRTALFWAVVRRKWRSAQLLVEDGCDVGVRDRLRRTIKTFYIKRTYYTERIYVGTIGNWATEEELEPLLASTLLQEVWDFPYVVGSMVGAYLSYEWHQKKIKF